MIRASRHTSSPSASDGSALSGAGTRLGRNYGPTTDHAGGTQRTSTVNMDTSDKWFTLDNRGGPIWGSRGREFKSRQPDHESPSGSGFAGLWKSSRDRGYAARFRKFQDPPARAAPRALAADRAPFLGGPQVGGDVDIHRVPQQGSRVQGPSSVHSHGQRVPNEVEVDGPEPSLSAQLPEAV